MIIIGKYKKKKKKIHQIELKCCDFNSFFLKKK